MPQVCSLFRVLGVTTWWARQPSASSFILAWCYVWFVLFFHSIFRTANGTVMSMRSMVLLLCLFCVYCLCPFVRTDTGFSPTSGTLLPSSFPLAGILRSSVEGRNDSVSIFSPSVFARVYYLSRENRHACYLMP